jgi:hypothetical protein
LFTQLLGSLIHTCREGLVFFRVTMPLVSPEITPTLTIPASE